MVKVSSVHPSAQPTGCVPTGVWQSRVRSNPRGTSGVGGRGLGGTPVLPPDSVAPGHRVQPPGLSVLSLCGVARGDAMVGSVLEAGGTGAVARRAGCGRGPLGIGTPACRLLFTGLWAAPPGSACVAGAQPGGRRWRRRPSGEKVPGLLPQWGGAGGGSWPGRGASGLRLEEALQLSGKWGPGAGRGCRNQVTWSQGFWPEHVGGRRALYLTSEPQKSRSRGT